MSDLAAGLCLMVALSVVVYRLGLHTGRHSQRLSALAGLLAVVCLLSYCFLLWDNLFLARWLPFSNVIVIGNWLPLIAAFISGLAWSTIPGHAARRAVSVGCLLSMGAYVTVEPLLGNAPVCGTLWTQDGRCLQTTDATCAAASCATLLNLYNIPASEQELAELCLTRQGTRWQGLYRALKQKTRGTSWDVVIVDTDAIKPQLMTFPMIVSVGIDGSDPAARFYQQEMGVLPDRDHTIVLMNSMLDGSVEVADPDPRYGLEHWPVDVLKHLWRGKAFRIVRRSHSENLLTAAINNAGL